MVVINVDLSSSLGRTTNAFSRLVNTLRHVFGTDCLGEADLGESRVLFAACKMNGVEGKIDLTRFAALNEKLAFRHGYENENLAGLIMRYFTQVICVDDASPVYHDSRDVIANKTKLRVSSYDIQFPRTGASTSSCELERLLEKRLISKSEYNMMMMSTAH